MDMNFRQMCNVRAHLPLLSAGAGILLAACFGFWYEGAFSVQVSGSIMQDEKVIIDINDAAMEGNIDPSALTYEYASVSVNVEKIDSAIGSVQPEEDGELVSWGVLNYASAVLEGGDNWDHVVINLPADTKVRIPAGQEGSDNIEIYYGDICGYVEAGAVTCCESEEAAGAIADSVHEYSGTYGQLMADAVVYSEMSSDSEQVTTLCTGDTVMLVSSQYCWYYVEYDGGCGYMPSYAVYAGIDEPEWRIAEDQAEAAAALGESVVATAKEYLGCPYVWAASGPSRFDCSGFTMYIMAQYGVKLPHSAADQFSNYGTWVDEEDLVPGDLVYFRSGTFKSASHTGMYIGDGQFIHASSAGGCVTISSLSDDWYAAHYVGAKRMLGNS